MLESRFTFPIEMMDPQAFDESVDPVKDCEDFFKDPPPGIDPIHDIKIVKIEPDGVPELDMVLVHVEMSAESFIRNCVQYGVDPYCILEKVKAACGADVAREAITFLEEADLTVAIIRKTVEGYIEGDQWPKRPEL